MKFFQRPAAALLLAVLLVPSSLLLSTKIKLGDLCRELEESFYNGSEEYGKPPAYYIDSRISDAASLATIGSHYEELSTETQALRQARSALVSACEAEDIHAMYQANCELEQAAAAFDQAVANVRLTELDGKNYPDFRNEFSGAQRHLEDCAYNRNVITLREDVLERFPASVLAPLVGVEAPPMFE